MLSTLARRVSRPSMRSACTRAPESASGFECFVWGKGGDGCLGLEDRADQSLPELLEFEHHDGNVLAFAAGAAHSAVIDSSHRLWTFGKSEYGRLGIGQKSQPSGPVCSPVHVDIPFADEEDFVVGVDTGHYHTAVVSRKGHVYTWGWGGRWFSGAGGLGHGNLAQVDSPKLVQWFDDQKIKVKEVVCGKYHTLALDRNGQIYSWGRGEFGRLGVNSNRDRTLPTRVDPFLNDDNEQVVQLSSGSASSAALTSKGRLFMWGKNDTGQLGLGGSSNLDMFALEGMPTLVEALVEHPVRQVACSDRHTLACTASGRVFMWGDRQWMTPFELSKMQLGNEPVVQVAAGHNFSALLTSSGNAFSWGVGRSCSLGHGDKETIREPTLISAFDGRQVVAITAGNHHMAALVTPQ